MAEVKKTKQPHAQEEPDSFYHDIIDCMRDTVWVIDLSGEILDVNKAAVENLGYTKNEILARGLSGIDASLSKETIRDLVKKMPTDRFQVFETGHRRKDGSVVPVEICSSLLSYKNNMAILSIARDITERKHAEEKIRTLLDEKELLLKETHHRIKNNMGIVKSLLNLQAQASDQEPCKEALFEAAGRVQSIMVLYDKLYRSENHDALNIRDFLPPLVNEITRFLRTGVTVKTDLQMDDLVIEANTLSSLVIIINECITNSMKYAFHDTPEPCIRLDISRQKGKTILTYQDNGSGISDEEFSKNTSTFGFRLITMLVKQLDGTLNVTGNEGLRVEIAF
ncbi:MAG: PAS domain S-box protein [Spirochaetales bacterium]|nr:PAS domain S-box protein [Spirochaetales bacterium]